MKKIKYYIYPLVILFVVLILSIFKIHGSSIGFYNIKLYGNSNVKEQIFGEPRAVRSDEYIVSTPLLISQDLNNEPVLNQDVGLGLDLGSNYEKPTSTIFSIFKPSQWIFFTSNNLDFNFAFHWWIKHAIMLIGVYLLSLKLTKKNLFLSISSSLLFLFTPFIQWWLPLELIGYISFAIFFFLKILDEQKIKNTILNTLGFSFSLISFALLLYPPFQVSLAWVAVFLSLGYIFSNRKNIFKLKNILRISVSVLVSIGLTVLFGYLFYTQFKDVINLTMNTVYPGARFMSAGQGSFDWLMNGFINILLQKTSNGIHSGIGNQCEASNFLLISIFFIPWIIYKNIRSISEKKKIDTISISLILCLIFFLSWYILPLPDLFSRYSFLYMVLPQRLFIGIGYASYILLMIFLSKKKYLFKKENKLDVIVLVLSVLIALTKYYVIIKGIFDINPSYFLYPTFIPSIVKAGAVVLLVPFLCTLALLNYRKLFFISLLAYGFLSVFFVNPIYKGLDVLTNTKIAKEIKERDEGRWIVYGDYTWAQYVILNGGNSVNGTNLYPLFELWNVIDPDEKYIDIYNRYANIAVSAYEQGEETVVLNHPDALTINIDPCDSKLDELNVKYILSDKVLDFDCGNLEENIEYPSTSFYLYKLNE